MKKAGIVLTVTACALSLMAYIGGGTETTAALTETSGTEKTAGTTTGTTTGITTDATTDTITAQTEAEAKPSTGLSGKVMAYMPSPAGLVDKLTAGFEEKTGVKVESFQGTTGEILARLEVGQANSMTDVVILASWADGLSMKKDGQLIAYETVGTDRMNPDWVGEEHMPYGTSASAVGVIYNTMVFPSLDVDWKGLADVAYKDQLAIPDPEKPGTCKDFLFGFITAQGEGGWNIWQALADNGMTAPRTNKATLEVVTTGEKGILVAGVDYNTYSPKEKGEPLDVYYPASGTVVNLRPAMILKTSPDVDNVRAFMNYLISDEVQQLVADAYPLPGRGDVKCENRTNPEEIPRIRTDWDKMMGVPADMAARLNEICR